MSPAKSWRTPEGEPMWTLALPQALVGRFMAVAGGPGIRPVVGPAINDLAAAILSELPEDWPPTPCPSTAGTLTCDVKGAHTEHGAWPTLGSERVTWLDPCPGEWIENNRRVTCDVKGVHTEHSGILYPYDGELRRITWEKRGAHMDVTIKGRPIATEYKPWYEVLADGTATPTDAPAPQDARTPQDWLDGANGHPILPRLDYLSGQTARECAGCGQPIRPAELAGPGLILRWEHIQTPPPGEHPIVAWQTVDGDRVHITCKTCGRPIERWDDPDSVVMAWRHVEDTPPAPAETPEEETPGAIRPTPTFAELVAAARESVERIKGEWRKAWPPAEEPPPQPTPGWDLLAGGWDEDSLGRLVDTLRTIPRSDVAEMPRIAGWRYVWRGRR